MPNPMWKERVQQHGPLIGKLVGSTAGYVLAAALASESGAPPAALAVVLGGIGTSVAQYVASQFSNLDLYGEDLTKWLKRSERDPHHHLRNHDIHQVAGLTIRTLIEGYIKQNPGERSDDFKERLKYFQERWDTLDPSKFPHSRLLRTKSTGRRRTLPLCRG